MRAARTFAIELQTAGRLACVAQVTIDLYGSLALTGRGHGTDRAVFAGLKGEEPEIVDPTAIDVHMAAIRATKRISLLGSHVIRFDHERDLRFHVDKVLPRHANGMRFTARDVNGVVLAVDTFYSVGGGFIERESAETAPTAGEIPEIPYPFTSAADLLGLGRAHHKSIAELIEANEAMWRHRRSVRDKLLEIWRHMQACVRRGLTTDGILPGGLGVVRRAPRLARESATADRDDPLHVLDWVAARAIAVNEENAAGGRVVTAPTNGAAGLIPAVLHYYARFIAKADDDGICRFLLTAGAVGMLYKMNASISGAEVGCQGEVGVACSMAAAGLAAATGGSNAQAAQAAEIGMEHHLGLTCDPVGGLVQIPCIERNAVGAVKAIQAARLALHGRGEQRVSLDQVIETMRQTGQDMKASYKETSLGGLAVNVVEC